jgi:hypothetical protein
MKFESIVVLGAATLAVAQPRAHNHAHHHPARHGSPVDARDLVTEVAPPVIATVYEVNGTPIPYKDVEQGLKDGKYILVPEATTSAEPTTSVAPSTSSTPTPTPTPTPSPTSEAAKFFQKPSSSETPTSTYVAPTTSAAPSPTSTYVAPAPASSSSSSSSGSTGGTGLTQEFKSGQHKCTEFPADYGVVYADWLELSGWTGIQNVPGFSLGIDAAISYISTVISGSGQACTENSFCSYACPAGYQKSQWPTAQGATGQSIGGLYCNSNGYLELANDVSKYLCIPGTGGVEVSNKLSKNVCVCRTDYPGTESETVALDTQPGQTYPLTCPDASTYYKWENAGTSAQYYINPQGVPASKACTWSSEGSNCGNWAPVNAGVGKGTDGVTYLSIFPNAPTNPDGTLDYSIKITGDVSDDCSYSGGTYTMNGNASPHGCTVSSA